MASGQQDEVLSHYLLVFCGMVIAAVATWKTINAIIGFSRMLLCIDNPYQRYFTKASPSLANFKRHVLEAPIFRKRHNQELRIHSRISFGTLPTRLQLVLMLAYFSMNLAFSIVGIGFNRSYDEFFTLIGSRTGVLATINMIPLFLLASRNNPLTPYLGIPFDLHNFFHRWLGRIVALEALAHTMAHLARSRFSRESLEMMTSPSEPFFMWGFIGTAALIGLCIQAWKPLRHAAYEIFKILHVGLAGLAIAGLWYHLMVGELAQIKYLFVIISFWAADHVIRGLRIAYLNIGISGSATTVEALPGDACRLVISMPRAWSPRPGQHAYLYMPGISLWQSHPFSIAWTDERNDLMPDRLFSDIQHSAAIRKPQLSFVIRARTGMTKSLYRKALATPGGITKIMCLVEGPYGVGNSLNSYGTVIFFAGGVGITHHLLYIRDLMVGIDEGTVAARKILLIWSIQHFEHFEWVMPWIKQLQALDEKNETLRIMIFVSRRHSLDMIPNPSFQGTVFCNRPNIGTLVAKEQEQQIGAMAVVSCGPGGFSDEVRQVVRAHQSKSNIDLIEESFSI
ncbi:ferric reductase like transmembrane component [Stachybotrys elegans]|uniref:ferric-chelate reductase (NADPH) n=1 Tax=Stachybotrys elegans TaxID=80388 RepID=A0A8K0SCK2_9HYPO|nr:ferric reductase like transmembrane component [Stachybotrys elegans]